MTPILVPPLPSGVGSRQPRGCQIGQGPSRTRVLRPWPFRILGGWGFTMLGRCFFCHVVFWLIAKMKRKNWPYTVIFCGVVSPVVRWLRCSHWTIQLWVGYVYFFGGNEFLPKMTGHWVLWGAIVAVWVEEISTTRSCGIGVWIYLKFVISRRLIS